MNKDFQGPLYCLKKPVHSPVEKNAGWAIYGEGKGAQTKTGAAWPGLQWCNFSTNTCSPWKFFELYLPCPNTFSSSEIPQIVYPNKEFSISSQYYCLQPTLHIHWSPGDVDISPRHQPIRGRDEVSRPIWEPRKVSDHKMLRIFIKTMGGAVWLLLSGDWCR